MTPYGGAIEAGNPGTYRTGELKRALGQKQECRRNYDRRGGVPGLKLRALCLGHGDKRPLPSEFQGRFEQADKSGG